MSSSNPKNLNARTGNRKTIAFFSERYLMPGSYFCLQWEGVNDQAKMSDLNLVSVIGGYKGTTPSGIAETCRNTLYDLVKSNNFDGIIIAGGILTYITTDEIRTFFARYSPIPLVAIAETLPETPSVLVENGAGMREVFVHMIEHHGFRRIAFIRGPGDFGDALVRFKIYKDVLAEYGLPYDPQLVTVGDYIHPSGAQAVRTLYDERKVTFEAIVAANDNMALGAMREIQRRGIRIPGDVAVAGYDNTDEAKMADPALTTVHQPIYEQGKAAVKLLLKIIDGEERPDNLILPTRMVIGQSCGCLLPTISHAGEEPRINLLSNGIKVSPSLEETLRRLRPHAAADMVRAVSSVAKKKHIPLEQVQSGMYKICDDFFKDLFCFKSPADNDHGPGSKEGRCGGDSFLRALTEMLHFLGGIEGDAMLWHDVISAMRRNLLTGLTETGYQIYAEQLWGQARVLLSNVIERMEVTLRYQVGNEIARINEMSEALSTTFDFDRIIGLLAERIDSLKISSCYLALYDDANSAGDTGAKRAPRGGSLSNVCRLMLAYSDGKRRPISVEQSVYQADQILPEGFWPDRRYHLVIESLHFLENRLGIILFEAGPRNGDTYETLRHQISNALQGSYLVQEVSERARAQEKAKNALEYAYGALEKANEEINMLNKRLTDENFKMHMEMDLARRLQTALLPSDIRSIHPDFDITAVMMPAEQVGGDYYDVTLDRDNKLWLGIGDVSGHGLTPGLIMMMAQTIHTAIRVNYDVDARSMVNMINKALFKNVQTRLNEEHFMSFTTLKYLEKGRFQFAGAHLDLLLYRKQTKECELIVTPGFWLNFLPDIEDVTVNSEFVLDTGDILVLYTDGLIEARNGQKKLFDLPGLTASVKKHAEKDVDALKQGIIDDVMEWSDGKQRDDMSLVVARRIN